MKVLSRLEWTILLVLIVYSLVPAMGGLFRILELASGLVVLPVNPRALANPVTIAAHALASALFCVAGALQFLPSIRRNKPTTHRVIGRVVVVAGCLSAATGVWMTHFFAFPPELQGSLLYLARMILGFSMIGLLLQAVIAATSRDIFRHSISMLRAYAIGQGASTQGFLITSWIIVVGVEPLGLLRDGLMVLAWVLNLLVAEIVIRRVLVRKDQGKARNELLTSSPPWGS